MTLKASKAVLVGVAFVSWSGLAQGQTQQFHKPMAPIGPTSEFECQALERNWSNTCDQIKAAHQQCLDANKDPKIQRAGECDKAPCLDLHRQMSACDGGERQQAVSSCYASVNAYKSQQAAAQRAYEAQVREARAAEQERQARLRVQAEESRRQADAARLKRAEYNAKKLKLGGVQSEASYKQLAQMDALRQQAEDRAANRPSANRAPVTAPHEAIPNETLPQLTEPLDFVEDIVEQIPGLGETTKITTLLKGFAEVHDGRRAEVETARDCFNNIFRRERPDDHAFSFGMNCTWNAAGCQRVYESLSLEARDRYDDYQKAMDRYISWTDIGNITRKGWTDEEKARFISHVGDQLWGEMQEEVKDLWGVKLPNLDLKKNVNEFLKAGYLSDSGDPKMLWFRVTAIGRT
jgi:hypothetical protein